MAQQQHKKHESGSAHKPGQISSKKVDMHRQVKSSRVHWQFPFSRQNFIYLAIGLGVILLGYALMATGITDQPALPNSKWDNVLAVWIAPFILVVGYCLVVPFAIMKFFSGTKEGEETTESK